MMKKAISLFLAVSVLCFATSAMAISTNTLTGKKSGADEMPTTSGGSMPYFRNGDTISFNVSDVSSGKELTLISYKDDDTSAVQYINQYTLSSLSEPISYTIPDTAATGTYVIKINDEENTAAEFYYKVGNIKAELITNRNASTNTGTIVTGQGDPYMIQLITEGEYNGKYSVAFLGKVTIADANGLTLSDLDATPGFEVENISTNRKTTSKFGIGENPSVSALQGTMRNAEVGGDCWFVYALTIYSVPSVEDANNLRATATLD